jgi:hypothetical protein
MSSKDPKSMACQTLEEARDWLDFVVKAMDSPSFDKDMQLIFSVPGRRPRGAELKSIPLKPTKTGCGRPDALVDVFVTLPEARRHLRQAAGLLRDAGSLLCPKERH